MPMRMPIHRKASERPVRVLQNRGSLTRHLPHIEEVIEPESLICACGGWLHRIGKDTSDRLHVIPAQFRVIVPRRQKYARRACTDRVPQTPAPARLIPGGLPTEATIAHVRVSEYDDRLPLYRQAQIYSRQWVDLDRSTLSDRAGRAAYELWHVFNAPIAEDSVQRIGAFYRIEADIRSLDPAARLATGSERLAPIIGDFEA